MTRTSRLDELRAKQKAGGQHTEKNGRAVPPPAQPKSAAPGPQAKKPKLARQIKPYQPFPVEALPSPLSEYVQAGASALRCDPAYLALPALSVAASVIGNTW